MKIQVPPYDEMGEGESEPITSQPNNDLGGFDEQICGPLPSNDDHVNASPSKYNTTDLVNENLPKKLEITYNQTLQAIMNEPSDVISEPSVPNLKFEKPDPQTGDDDDGQPIKLSYDIPSLYNFVNEIYTDMQEYKKLCKSLSNQVFHLTNRINEIGNQFLKFKNEVAGRVLGNEIKIEKIENKRDANMDSITKKVDRNSTNIGNIINLENANKRLEQDILTANKRGETNIKELRVIADEVKLISQNVTCNPQNAQPKTDVIFNHDVLFLVDSNLKTMIPEKMDRNSTCVSHYCPTLNHIRSLMKIANIQKNPSKIFIHCGTNHIYPLWNQSYLSTVEPIIFIHCGTNHNYSGSKNTSKLENDYMTIIEELHNRFPSTKIFISLLLPRGDPFVKNNVQYVNDFLSGVCSGAPFL